MLLHRRPQDSDFLLVAKNDEVYESLVSDENFYKDMRNKNEESNLKLRVTIAGNNTQGGNNAAQNGHVLIKNTNEKWINNRWRPMMGWLYFITCITDFILFPVLWSVLQAYAPNGVITEAWSPLTLQGAGLFHLAMGAVLGIAVYGRTQEKLQHKEGYHNH